MPIKDQLLKQLAATSSMPFLFVGSGISRRYLGLETWSGLLRRFSEKTGVDYEFYLSKADGDFPRLASLLVPEFHSVWWKSKEYEASRSAFKASVKRKDSPLKLEISQYMSSMTRNEFPAALIGEVEQLRRVTVDGIITTNWDGLLERLFPDYETYIGQDHLLFSQPQSIAEIYKIHGSYTEPDSLVLTEEDYARFRDRNAYLAAKLLTVFVEHPVVFLGYSLSDPHIVEILEAIASCITGERLEELSGRLFFVEYDHQGNGDSIAKSFVKRLPLTLIRTRDFAQIYEALAAKPRRIPAKTLRRVKEHLYELVRTNDQKVEKYVRSFEELDGAAAAPEFYAGVGQYHDGTSDLGYKRIKTYDVLKDVALSGSSFDSERLLQFTFPELLKNAKLVPVFKYLRRSNRIVDDAIAESDLDPRVRDRVLLVEHENYMAPGKYHRSKVGEVLACGSVAGVRSHFGDEKAMIYVTFLTPDMVDVKELEVYLRQCEALVAGRGGSLQSQFARLVCYYDWLVFAPRRTAG